MVAALVELGAALTPVAAALLSTREAAFGVVDAVAEAVALICLAPREEDELGVEVAVALPRALLNPSAAEVGCAVTGAAAPGDDVVNALLALGYSDKEATLALKQVPAGSSVSDGIRHALKALSKS